MVASPLYHRWAVAVEAPSPPKPQCYQLRGGSFSSWRRRSWRAATLPGVECGPSRTSFTRCWVHSVSCDQVICSSVLHDKTRKTPLRQGLLSSWRSLVFLPSHCTLGRLVSWTPAMCPMGSPLRVAILTIRLACPPAAAFHPFLSKVATWFRRLRPP